MANQFRENLAVFEQNKGGSPFGKSSAESKSLEELCLSGNSFSIKGFEQIAKYCQSLKSFGIDKCGLDKNSYSRLQKCFSVAKNLRVLSLELNNIANHGIKGLLDYFQGSKILKYLNISENNLSQESIQPIANFIAGNEVLEGFECEKNE